MGKQTTKSSLGAWLKDKIAGQMVTWGCNELAEFFDNNADAGLYGERSLTNEEIELLRIIAEDLR